MMLVIEGRLVGRSLGIGLPDCTEILLGYDAYQAMNMDGGTSSVMWYDGEYICDKMLEPGHNLPLYAECMDIRLTFQKTAPDAVFCRYNLMLV